MEAVLDVQGIFPTGVKLEDLAELREAFQEFYPTRTEQRLLQFNFQHQAGQEPSAMIHDQGIRGYRFHSSDEKEIVQCRKDGFTFNRMKPYTQWEEIYPRALKAREIFRQAFPDFSINRVSLRYVNQVVVPSVGWKFDLNAYFSVDLPGPKYSQLSRVGFIAQSMFFDPQTEFHANWVMAHQPNPEPDKMTVTLDIDVFCLGPKVLEISPPDLWKNMRGLENKLL